MLKHLRKYRTGWNVDVRVGRGKHTALVGLCRRVYTDQDPDPVGPYDSIADLGWYENYLRFPDRPNSKVTNCLQEVFGIDYDPSLGRYQLEAPPDALHRAAMYLRTIGCHEQDGKFDSVIIHYEGNTSPSKKNLHHWQAQAFVDLILRAGKKPIIFDWDNRSPLPNQVTVFNPKCGVGDVWGGFGSGDAATIAALIRLSTAMVGIDSGPGKIASTTETPFLCCWRGHHPIQFHDPAPNTVHLVPENHRGMPPACDDPRVGDYFERHYQFLTYQGEHGLVARVLGWLQGVLGMDEDLPTPVKFVLPAGIGDTVWALLKIKSIAAGRPIDLIVSGDPRKEIDRRSIPFLKRFSFVREATTMDVPVIQDRDNPTNNRGRYNYVSDGPKGPYHFLVPNTVLESGRRLDEWLSEYPIDWSVVDTDFSWEGTERGTQVGKGMKPFAAFYLGPENGHAKEGHNRNWLWEPRHWIELAQAFKARGLAIAVVGAAYDRSFWERYVQKGVEEAGMSWIDLIGRLEIGETFAFLKEAKCFVSYQCGLAIFAQYLGVPTVSWWRPDGDSCHPERLVSFDERMRDGWVRPEYRERYLGLVYTREGPDQIVAEIDKRGWLK